MKNLCEYLKSVNDTMEGFGFHNKVHLGNDYIKVHEDRIIICIPYEVTLKIEKKRIDDLGSFKEALKEAFKEVFGKGKS